MPSKADFRFKSKVVVRVIWRGKGVAGFTIHNPILLEDFTAESISWTGFAENPRAFTRLGLAVQWAELRPWNLGNVFYRWLAFVKKKIIKQKK